MLNYHESTGRIRAKPYGALFDCHSQNLIHMYSNTEQRMDFLNQCMI